VNQTQIPSPAGGVQDLHVIDYLIHTKLTLYYGTDVQVGLVRECRLGAIFMILQNRYCDIFVKTVSIRALYASIDAT
jgi:hypothetical protein